MRNLLYENRNIYDNLLVLWKKNRPEYLDDLVCSYELSFNYFMLGGCVRLGFTKVFQGWVP